MQSGTQFGWERCGALSRDVNAGDRDSCVENKFLCAMDFLIELQTCAAQPGNLRNHHQQIVKFGRGAIACLDRAYDKSDAFVGHQRVLRKAERSQPFGAGTFAEPQVVGVVDEPRCVGVLVVHSNSE